MVKVVIAWIARLILKKMLLHNSYVIAWIARLLLKKMLLHNSYYSDTGSQEILIFSPKTVQSLPHPAAMITFSVAMTYYSG